VDLVTGLADAVQSGWVLPALPLMIAVDGPFPVLPSETVLMTAVALAFGAHDVGMLVALFSVAVLGSVLGDLAVFGLGRSSHRLVGGAAEHGLASWVRRHMLARPGTALVGARFLPGGRLVSTAAAGRFGLPVRVFLPWSLVSSLAWATYMLGIGRAIQPVTGGNPLLCVLASGVIAVVTGGLFALARRVVRGLAARRTAGQRGDRPVPAEAPRSTGTGHPA
jgi:membrane protein DedA with SNARE-associated domain